MSVNMGQAVGYLDLDTSKFKRGLKSALSDLKTFQSKTATSKDKLAAFSSAATSAGRSLTKSLTVPLLGVGAAAVTVTAKFDAGMSKVQAVSGATGKELEKLRDKAKEMGAKTKFSATQSAEAFNYMAMAGWKTEDMLNGIEGVMNLAAASGEDLATTSDIVTDALTAFGLSAEDSAHFADVLAANASNANTNVGMLGESFKYIAPVAGALGYSVEDINLALGLMANSGIKASQAGTALRSALTRMAKPTGDVQNAMEKYGISLTDAQGNMVPFRDLMEQLREKFSTLSKAEQAQAATTLFGKNAMSGMLAIINSSDKDWNKLANAIDNADGTAEKMAETMMDNLPGAITLAKSALEGLGIRIGEVMTPAITKIVKVFTSFISWLTQASDRTVKFAVGMGIVVASIGPALLIVGTLTRNVLTLIEAYEKLNKLLAGKTIGSILKAAGAKIVDMAATVKDTIANVVYQNSLRGTGSVITRAISKVLALAAAHKVAAGAALGIIGVFIGLAVYMKQTGTSIEEMKNKILDVFNKIIEQVPQIISTITQVASGIIKQIPSILSGVLSSLGQAITSGLSSLRDTLPKLAKWWAQDMPELIKVGSDMVVNIINGFAESLPEMINTGSDMLVQLIDQFFNEAPRFIEVGLRMILSLIDGMMKALPQLVNAISNILTNNIGPIMSSIIKVLDLIVKALVKNLPVILQAITTILIAIVNAIVANAPQIIMAAFKLLIALATGILKAIPQILLAVAQIGLAIVQALLAIIGSIVGAGVKIVQALVSGMVSAFAKLISLVYAKMVQLKNKALAPIVALKKSFVSYVESIKSAVVNKFSSMVNTIKSKVNSLKNFVLKPIQNLVKKINGLKAKLHLSIPKISVSGGKAPWGIAGKGKLPSFHIKWNKEGGIFTGATIFGAKGNTLLGAGEAGAEALVPLSELWRRFDSMLELLRELVITVKESFENFIDEKKINFSRNDYDYSEDNFSIRNSIAALQETVANLSGAIQSYSNSDVKEALQEMASALSNTTIQSDLIVDGRTLAKNVAKPFKNEMKNLDIRDNRKKGYAL